ncbi:hypothetical protein CR513_03827, partial [Mucuna pruriens]
MLAGFPLPHSLRDVLLPLMRPLTIGLRTACEGLLCGEDSLCYGQQTFASLLEGHLAPIGRAALRLELLRVGGAILFPLAYYAFEGDPQQARL